MHGTRERRTTPRATNCWAGSVADRGEEIMRLIVALLLMMLMVSPSAAATVAPVSDATLRDGASAIVHGVVTDVVTAEEAGQPATVITIRPIERVKGLPTGDLVLHQLGGTLPNGRFLKVFGAPQYVRGSEALVFAIKRPDGTYQTSEMFLGHFDVKVDTAGVKFAVPATPPDASIAGAIQTSPRGLARFIRELKKQPPAGPSVPSGALRDVVDPTLVGPQPFNLSLNTRWDNGATVGWNVNGAINGVADGGIANLQAAIN